MKRIFTFLLLTTITIGFAQSKYEKGMTKAFELWDQKKLDKASQLFERITKAEPDNWLPPYYVATIEIVSSFGIKDEATLTNKLKKAQEYLDIAKGISPNNPEIIINQALLNTAYIAFDGQKYGMTLAMKNNALYEEAFKIAPKNPRVVLGKAEWNMGSARYFNQSITPYCKDVEKAIKLFDAEKLPPFYPSYGKDRALQVAKQCKKS